MNPTAIPTTSTLLDQAKQVTDAVPGVMEKIPVLVDKTLGVLANRFGSTGEYLWKAIVKYQFASGLADVLISFVLGGVALFMFKVASKHYKTATYDQDADAPNADAVIAGLSTIAFLAMMLFAIGFFHEGIISVVAPEGAAIHMVLDSIKSGSN